MSLNLWITDPEMAAMRRVAQRGGCPLCLANPCACREQAEAEAEVKDANREMGLPEDGDYGDQ